MENKPEQKKKDSPEKPGLRKPQMVEESASGNLWGARSCASGQPAGLFTQSDGRFV